MKKAYKLEVNPVSRQGAIVQGEKYRFTVLTDSLIRMEYQEEGRFVDQPTQRVICRDFPVLQFRVIDQDDSLEIITDKLHLYYDKKVFSQRGLTIQMKEGFHVYGSAWSYGDPIEDLKGTTKTLDNADGAVELDSGLLSRSGFSLLDDSNTALLERDQWPIAKAWDSTDLYFFGYGHDYLGCLKDFYHLSGATPLLPRFTLGNWWSRFYQYTQESYLDLMDRFREKGIPFSTAVIDMDWHLTKLPKKYGSGWTGYTWNPEFFPDPKGFMEELHTRGMHVTLNVHPADGVRGHEEAYLEMAKELGIDYENEDKIPFDAGSRAFLEAYFRHLHHPHEERGVDFWWLDWQQGSRGSAEGIDTLWMLNHLHFLDSGRSGKKPLTFSRYAGIGSHRYPVGFSGDTFATWESLDFQPYFTANASNAGYSWWSHDIGGHQGGRKDDELAVRWLQFGVFSPIMRLHSTSNEFYGKEPWNYNAEAEKTMTDFLRLRHCLIPYLYSMNYLTHLQGLPLLQPMYYHHDVPEAYQVPNQYWFGTQMIVCPITKPMDPQLRLAGFEAWLPEGDYIDFFTGKHYRGDRTLTLYRGLDTIPVLVKAGGIIPLAGDYHTAHMGNPTELDIHVFNGADGAFDLYEDHGDDRGEDAPVITKLRFTTGQQMQLSVEPGEDRDGVIPVSRCYHIHVRGVEEPQAVELLDGAAIFFTCSYAADKKELCLDIIPPAGECFGFKIETDNPEIASPDRKKVIYTLLHRAQISYAVKQSLYQMICEETNLTRLLGKLNQMHLDPMLTGAIVEQIVAEY